MQENTSDESRCKPYMAVSGSNVKYVLGVSCQDGAGPGGAFMEKTFITKRCIRTDLMTIHTVF